MQKFKRFAPLVSVFLLAGEAVARALGQGDLAEVLKGVAAIVGADGEAQSVGAELGSTAVPLVLGGIALFGVGLKVKSLAEKA